MRNKLSSADDHEFIHKLRFQLLSKVSEEWDIKWRKKHGSTFAGVEKLKSKNAFYEDLRIDICNYIENKIGKTGLQDYFISKD